MTLFAIVQFIFFATAVAFCVVGAWASGKRLRRQKRRALAYHHASSIILDAGTDLDAASRDLARVPIPLLAEVLQQLAADTTGEARRRLRVVAQHAGLTRRIERLSRRRTWHRRAQAAHLLMLLPSGALERDLLLRDSHPMVRARAIESVSTLGIATFVDLFLEALSDESPAVRSAAQHALSRGDIGCVTAIVEALHRAELGELDPEVTVLITEIAAELPDPRLAESLLGFASHDDPRLRRLVAVSLGGRAFANGSASLATLLIDDEADVRAEAAKAIGSGQFTDLAPSLGRMLGDEHWQVRREAGSALAQLGPAGRIVLRCHLDDRDSFASDMARHMLGESSGLASISRLRLLVP
ncbi:MAG: HEAT repeat domain-containing protein [Acidimicrobiales bacterium]